MRWSLEFYTPKFEGNYSSVREKVIRLSELYNSEYIDVTWPNWDDGTKMCNFVEYLNELSISITPHLVSSRVNKSEVSSIITRLKKLNNVKQFLFVTGDLKNKGVEYYRDSTDLLRYMSEYDGVRSIASCYPDSIESYNDTFKKCDYGVREFIGQICYNIDNIERFRDKLSSRNKNALFIPGISPKINKNVVDKINNCIKDKVQFVSESESNESFVRFVEELRNRGFTRLHLYTFNYAEPFIQIHEEISGNVH